MRMLRKPLAVLIAALFTSHALALPSGGTFNIGTGSISTSGATTTVNVTGVPAGYTMPGMTAPALITWSGGYNVAPGEAVAYTTPLTQNVQVVNYDPSGQMSKIGGTITAPSNMAVVVVNPNGVEISNTANITAKALSAAVGTMTVTSAGQGKMKLTLMPGDLDVAPGAALTATDTNCSPCTGFGDATGNAISIAADSANQTLSLPLLQGYGLIDLTKAGVQDWVAPNQLRPTSNSSLNLADGSSLTLKDFSALTSTALSVRGALKSLTLDNTNQSVLYAGRSAASAMGDTDNVTLNNYGGTLKAYYGIDNLTLRGDNSLATIYASVFKDTRVDGNVLVGNTTLATRGFGGTADGWSLGVASGKSLEIHGGPVPQTGKYDTQAMTDRFGKLTDGSVPTGAVSGSVTVVTSPANSDMKTPYTYTFGPEVTVNGTLNVNQSILDYSGVQVRTNTFYDATGIPTLSFDGFNSPNATVYAKTWDAGGGYASGIFSNAETGYLGAGDILVANSKMGATTLSTAGNITMTDSQLGGTQASAGGDLTATNTTVTGTQVTLGGVRATVLNDSTVNATSSTLGLASGYTFNSARNYGVTGFLGLNNTTVDKRALDTTNKMVLVGNRVVTDAETVLRATAAQGAAFTVGLGFDITQPAWYNNGTATLGNVYVADTANININTSSPVGAQNASAKYNQVAVTDLTGKLGTPRNFDTVGLDAPAQRGNVGVTFRSSDVLLRGAVQVNGPNGATSAPVATTPDTRVTVSPITQTPASVVFNPTGDVASPVLPPMPTAPISWQVDSGNLPQSYVVDTSKLSAPLLPTITLQPLFWSLNTSVSLPTDIVGNFVRNAQIYASVHLDPTQWKFVERPVLASVVLPTAPAVAPPNWMDIDPALPPVSVDASQWAYSNQQQLATVTLPDAPAVSPPVLPAKTATLPPVMVDANQWAYNHTIALPPVTLPGSLPATPAPVLPAPVVVPSLANPLMTGVNVEFSDAVTVPTLRGSTLYINPNLGGGTGSIVPVLL